MPRTNKTEFAVLGLLSLEPMSGYDMKTFISQSIGYFWQESYGQIYPVLRKLLGLGFITRRVESKKGRPDRHVYRLTQKGRNRLNEWLASETELAPLRIELLLKLFFGGATPG
jgi:PadR family transcriptional regulator AphA